MKKVLFIVAVALGFVFQANAQQLEFTNLGENNTLDYGEIEPNADGVRVVTFKNVGDAPLILSKVKASCGCTIPSYDREPLMPGKTAEITVKYSTSRKGPINKVITVYSNDIEKPTTLIRLKGKVLNGTEE